MSDIYNPFIPLAARTAGLGLFAVIHPLPAYLINSFIFDSLDFSIGKWLGIVPQNLSGESRTYFIFDKIGDTLLRTVALLFAPKWFGLLLGLYLFRMIGEILAIKLNKPSLLRYFPNLFEVFYIASFFDGPLAVIIIVFGIILKMVQEWYLH